MDKIHAGMQEKHLEEESYYQLHPGAKAHVKAVYRGLQIYCDAGDKD